MDALRLKQILEEVKSGDLPVDEALSSLRTLPYDDIGCAKLDLHRGIRTGFPEVVFCQGKTDEQAVDIVKRLAGHHTKVLATRVAPEVAGKIAAAVDGCTYHSLARILVVDKPGEKPDHAATDGRYVMVLCAGTADISVAEEAAITAESMGSRVERSYDVGVAGLHRLLDQRDRIMQANVLVVVAGMEGALPSVVGGMVSCPVIAVPTSVGYGASFGGLAALLAMLNSCAAGVAVMNIDNGFGAGYFAHLVNR
ncbi:MAG: nickel pincer cofactor biosynthesis protein LarB [Proteobacteria bacterium]|nr:nickel pincer cofactor biosynthesis protein LarB [Pseudomonadota bacterium]MBU4583324.1 nickel pincer cofactor biosynthesis protein LarB [Pseudomonadota bacterium]MCG2738806.1 nickel pincer cofactor biosynthesis protein LarB [Syntrophaceae bacterium]